MVDWDQGAGESWARVLRAGAAVGFIWARGPLAIVKLGAADDLANEMRSGGLMIVPVDDFSSVSSS
jgi:hypothetical protein